MNTIVKPEIREVLQEVHLRPFVSIILPFDPKMGLKTDITQSLKIAADKVERKMEMNYPDDIVKQTMQKLKSVIRDLNFNTHKKSIAIYISPAFEKVLYLDIAVEEMEIVNESFEIRDLVYSKKQVHNYLVLLLSSKRSCIFLGNSDSFVRILIDSSTDQDYENDTPEKVSNFSSLPERKEMLMHKFLNHIDNSLSIILKAYQLPLFILGTERIIGQFKQITKNSGAMIEYIQGNYEEISQHELKLLLEPHVADWKTVIQKYLFSQLDEAAGKNKLAVGIRDVWHEARQGNGRLLVVEKNYMYSDHGGSEDEIFKSAGSSSIVSNIKDAVDDAIEKILESGGDVEIVNQNVLNNFHHIALIKYY